MKLEELKNKTKEAVEYRVAALESGVRAANNCNQPRSCAVYETRWEPNFHAGLPAFMSFRLASSHPRHLAATARVLDSHPGAILAACEFGFHND